MNRLPLIARLYVAFTIAAGAVMLVVCLPLARFDHPLLFSLLLLLSSATAALKVYLPLTTGGSTMSVSYAVDFASLMLIGPDETMMVAAASAFCHCNFKSKDRNPPYRTLFSMASLDRKSTRLNSSHTVISYAVFCLKKKKKTIEY